MLFSVCFFLEDSVELEYPGRAFKLTGPKVCLLDLMGCKLVAEN